MRKLLGVALLALLLPLAAKEANAPVVPKVKEREYKVVSKPWTGMASWYGAHWDGRKVACGGVFDSHALTAAHPSLPCGTLVRVTNVRTKHAVVVKVTDRGPYAEGREMDVAEAAAQKIDIKKWGVEQVRLEIVR